MALIEIYHVVADMHPVDDQTIREGMLVKLDANASVIPCNVASERPIGVAGDNTVLSASNANKSTPYSANLTIGANGANAQWTQNRVSDYGNETLASAKMTVYSGGGKFATDQYDGTVLTWTSLLLISMIPLFLLGFRISSYLQMLLVRGLMLLVVVLVSSLVF